MGPKRKKTVIQRILRGGLQVTAGSLSTNTRKRPLEEISNGGTIDGSSQCNNYEADPISSHDTNNMTKTTEINAQEQATTISPLGATAQARQGSSQQQQHCEESPQRPKRQRMDRNDDNDASNGEDAIDHAAATTATAAVPSNNLALQTQTKRQKQIAYYRKCHQTANLPNPRCKAPCIPILALHQQRQRQQPRLLQASQLLATAWRVKLEQEHQNSLAMQSPWYQVLQLQLQQVLQQQEVIQCQQQEANVEQQQQQPAPSPQEQNLPPPNDGEESSSQPIPLSSQSQPPEPRDVAQLEHECNMWQIQNEQLQKDYQKERKSKLALEQENYKLQKKVVELKDKNKRLGVKLTKRYHIMAKEKSPASTTSSAPATPASTVNNSKMSPSSDTSPASNSSQLVPRELLNDYSPTENRLIHPNHVPEKPRLDEVPSKQKTKAKSRKWIVQNQQPATNAKDQSKQETNPSPAVPTPSNRTSQVPPSKYSNRESSKPKVTNLSPAVPTPLDCTSQAPSSSSHSDAKASKRALETNPSPAVPTPSDRSNQQPMSTPLAHKANNFDRVLPPPSSQASVETDATEWHKNTVPSPRKVLEKENMDPQKQVVNSPTEETQVTIPPSANLLADTEPQRSKQALSQATTTSMESRVSFQPSANLLAETDTTEIPTWPPSKSTVKERSKTDKMEEHVKEYEEEDPIQECNTPHEDRAVMPPPAPTTPTAFPTALSRMDLPMDSPPVQEASQTTFHDGRTSDARRKGTLETALVPPRIRLNPMKSATAARAKKVPASKESIAATTAQLANRPRRVTLSPNTKPMQLSLVASEPKSNGSARPDDSSRTTTTSNNNNNQKNPPLSTRPRSQYYWGFSRNLARQLAQKSAAPKPDDVPSDATMGFNPTAGFCQVISNNTNVGPNNNGKSTSSKAAAPKKKPPATTAPPASAARKPFEQPWLKNKKYNDFMEDTPPERRRRNDDFMEDTPPPPKRQPIAKAPQPYQPKILGDGRSKRSTETNFRYEEVVRNKAQRETMIAQDCPDCAGFFDQCNRDIGPNQLKCFCRHKTICTPTNTPEDFWELSFVDEKRKREKEEARQIASKLEQDEEEESPEEEEGSIQDV